MYAFAYFDAPRSQLLLARDPLADPAIFAIGAARPTAVVKDGEIIWRYEMDPVTDAERTPEVYWTEERQDQAVENFKKQMKRLKEA